MERLSLGMDTLQAAYDVCVQVKNFTGNVIASGDYEKSDILNHAKSKKFIDAFDKAEKNKISKYKSKGNWVEELQKEMDKLTALTEKLTGE